MQTGTMRLRELTVRYSVRKDGDGQPVVVGRDLSNPRDTAASLMTMLRTNRRKCSRSSASRRSIASSRITRSAEARSTRR